MTVDARDRNALAGELHERFGDEMTTPSAASESRELPQRSETRRLLAGLLQSTESLRPTPSTP
jgi:hypothetical protein